jgi:hypothetical protein
MSKKDNDHRQGRREEQMKSSYVGAFIGIIGILFFILVAYLSK